MKNHYIPENRFPVKIKDHVYMLGNYFFNLFLIIGKKKSAIFELGISATTDAVIRQLDQLGVAPDYLICSHPHSDHITGLPGLSQAYPNAKVVAAEGAAQFLSHPKAGPALLKEDAFMSKSIGNFGIRPGRPPLAQVPDLSDANVIEDCRGIDLGGVLLSLEKVEGHSPGNLVGRIDADKIVFCSDSLGFHFPGRGFLPLFFTQVKGYLAVLEKIRKINPKILCPAHQGYLENAAAQNAIAESIETTLTLIDRCLKTDIPAEILAEEIFKSSYRDEFSLYTKDNIKNCAMLLVKRARQFQDFNGPGSAGPNRPPK